MKFKGYKKLRQSLFHISMVNFIETEFGPGKFVVFCSNKPNCELSIALLLGKDPCHYGFIGETLYFLLL